MLMMTLCGAVLQNPNGTVVLSPGILEWEGARVDVFPLHVPPFVTLSTSVSINGIAAQPLIFTVGASFTATASIVLEGFMVGVWENVAGIPNLNVANVGASIGIGPGLPVCK